MGREIPTTTPAGGQDMRAEVVVVGAGPAGSIAALALARAGLDVVLLDRTAFPREKTCGDGLMPDALDALRALGLAERALSGARCLRTLLIYSPDGTAVTVNGEFAVVRRERFDASLCATAIEAGARFLAPVRAVAPIEDGGRVAGVIAEASDGANLAIHARVTVLATGAGSGPLMAFGVCDRSEPSATAARFYLALDPEASFDLDALCISYDRAICPGYGWVFPGPDSSYNIGVGYFAGAVPGTKNLRLLMTRFIENFPLVRELMRLGGKTTMLRGAPLRTGLAGSRLSRPGLLVAGEAAGLTYPISGEGIGKAIASGLLAADVIRDGLQTGDGDAAIAAAYAATLEAKFARRFQAYANAQRWVEHPRLLDFLAHRANAGNYVRRQIEGLINETAEPSSILSVRGILRSVFS
jgi:geranylgeranyl reductase family protein